MNSEKRNQLSELLSKIVDCRATDEDTNILESLLKDDDMAKEYYLSYIDTHCQLELAENSGNIIPISKASDVVKKRNLRFIVPLAVACVALISFIVISDLSKPESLDLTADATYKIDKVYAVVANAENAKWNLKGVAPESGTHLGLGVIKLSKGKLRLDFNNGEEITIAAPATFEIKDTNLMIMHSGQLAAHIPKTGIGFTVITPNGAVVDLGTDFAINVNESGENQVKVIKGAVIASSTDKNGNTSWGEELLGGEEAYIIKASPLQKITNQSQSYIKPLGVSIPELDINEAYDMAVKKSGPVGYWKFDHVSEQGLIKNEMGGQPLKLNLLAKIAQTRSGGRLELGKKNKLNEYSQGYAKTTKTISGLNTADGCTLEFWAYSSIMDWQTLAALSMNNLKFKRPSHIKHDPHFILVERAGLSGSSRSHIHPNLAMRAAYRNKPGYSGGGNNAYTTDSFLIHRWFHIAIVKKQGLFQIYIDGKLSAESEISTVEPNLNCDLIIGRMRTGADKSDSRQWVGAIDEAALYKRALSAEEIHEHYNSVLPENK